MSVLVCGEALIDLVPAEHGLLAPLPGGGPFNVAVALGRLGSEVLFLSRLSTDPYGELLMSRLRDAGVDLSVAQRGAEPTTLALTTLDDVGAARYIFYAEGTADRFVRDPGPLPDTVAAVSFGTLSLLYEPGASVYERLLARAHAAGRLTMLDPNIRPCAIVDPDGYRARFESWLGVVDVLKVSEDDAEWLGGTPDRWLAAGAGAVLLTQGGSGLSVFTAEARVHVEASQVEVADTIGAGDTAHAALLHWLDRADALSPQAVRALGEEDWRRALNMVARAAAITVSRPGADPPWGRELAVSLEPRRGAAAPASADRAR
jgi:fructokinase